MRHVYLIGPGGVGKTTVGPIVAAQLARPFVDLDQEFCETLGNIGVYISEQGYADYMAANSRLFAELVSKQATPVVMALSSGFLSSGDLPEIAAENLALTTASGTLVLLLPGDDIAKGAEIIVPRQLARGLGLRAEPERQKFITRASEYIEIADHRVDSTSNPVAIVQAIMRMLGGGSPKTSIPESALRIQR